MFILCLSNPLLTRATGCELTTDGSRHRWPRSRSELLVLLTHTLLCNVEMAFTLAPRKASVAIPLKKSGGIFPHESEHFCRDKPRLPTCVLPQL